MGEASEGGRAAEERESVEALQAALAAERARTREVEHRAKNDLQLVCSLLTLLSRRSPHEETRATLKALQQRVNAIAAVHRDFLDAGSADAFDLSRFLREQAPALAQGQGEGARVRLDLDAVQAKASAACPLALIASELILNALRHGRRGARAPTALVTLRRAGDGFELAVTDEGPGLAGAEPRFGLTMVRLLSQQIGASFALEAADPGLRAVVRAS